MKDTKISKTKVRRKTKYVADEDLSEAMHSSLVNFAKAERRLAETILTRALLVRSDCFDYRDKQDLDHFMNADHIASYAKGSGLTEQQIIIGIFINSNQMHEFFRELVILDMAKLHVNNKDWNKEQAYEKLFGQRTN